ncbi:hypothetical protein HYDPIDRAFT_67603, partial [Hydnomerulius pinastri MD-312]
GPNGVSNSVFSNCAGILTPHLGPVFRGTFTLEYYTEQWKISSTVALRKPGRPDYTILKAYWPIALLETVANILSSCIADDVTYIGKQFSLLPDTHFGG